jgi:hypothetical protein
MRLLVWHRARISAGRFATTPASSAVKARNPGGGNRPELKRLERKSHKYSGIGIRLALHGNQFNREP